MAKKARLVRGSTYYLGSKRFNKGVWKKVTDEEAERIQTHAIDRVSVHSGEEAVQEERPKFELADIEEDTPQHHGKKAGKKAGKKVGNKVGNKVAQKAEEEVKKVAPPAKPPVRG